MLRGMNRLERELGSIAKAIVAGAVAASAVAMTALADGHVTPAEWVGIAGAFLGGLGIVYSVPNVPQVPHSAPVTAPEPADADTTAPTGASGPVEVPVTPVTAPASDAGGGK